MNKLKIHPSVSFPSFLSSPKWTKSCTLYLRVVVFMSTLLHPFLLPSPCIFSDKENTLNFPPLLLYSLSVYYVLLPGILIPETTIYHIHPSLFLEPLSSTSTSLSLKTSKISSIWKSVGR